MTTKAAAHPQQMRTSSIVPIVSSVCVTLFILPVPGTKHKIHYSRNCYFFPSLDSQWIDHVWSLSWIQGKLCCIMHSVYNGNCPAYLSDIVQTVSASRPRLRLRSSTDYVLPRPRTKFGERVFSRAGPSAWNRLPEDIRAERNIANFRKHLKAHSFNFVFNVL